MNRGSEYDSRVHCIADLEQLARVKLTPMAAAYYAGGAMDLLTVKDNVASFDRYRLRPRMLRDVTNVDPSTICLGSKVTFPLGFSPAASQGMAHADGEQATSRAAAAKGINMALSTWSNSSLEDVVSHKTDNAYVQQLSVVKDEKTNLDIMRRAEKAGYKALFISVDCPWLGKRLNEFKNSFKLPTHLQYPNLPSHVDPHRMVDNDPAIAYETALTWDRIKWFKQNTSLEVWLKGILTEEDAELAVEAGADGIVVSNHGGRQLDGTLSTLDALPDVVAAVRGRIPVHMDGGIRRGSDVFKALALGAKHCWVGRVPIWGLAFDGERGVKLALDILADEFVLVMALMGCTRVDEIGPQHLARMALDGTFKRLEAKL